MADPNIVKAGHYYVSLEHMHLGEDGQDPAANDPDLPRDVFRITIANGRQIDLRGEAARSIRQALSSVALLPPGAASQGRHVGSSADLGNPVRRRSRKAK